MPILHVMVIHLVYMHFRGGGMGFSLLVMHLDRELCWGLCLVLELVTMSLAMMSWNDMIKL